MQLAFSSENIPSEQKTLCDEISVRLPVKKQRTNWKWWCPYITKRQNVSEKIYEEEIIKILNEQYELLQTFEKQLISALSNL